MTSADGKEKEIEIARAALAGISELHGVSGTGALTRLTLAAAELVDPKHVDNVIADAIHAADAALYLSAFTKTSVWILPLLRGRGKTGKPLACIFPLDTLYFSYTVSPAHKSVLTVVVNQPNVPPSLSEAGCRPENWKDKLPPLGGSS